MDKENKYVLKLKKNSVHVILKNNCTKYIVKDFIFFSFLNTRYDDIPINIYSIVQTIGKIIPGGVKLGLLIVSYPIDVFPKMVPIIPTRRGINRNIINVFIFI